MARLFIRDRQRGEYGHLNNTTTSTETRDKFNVSTEIDRISKKTICCYTYAVATPATETHYVYAPTTKVKVTAAKLIPSLALASNATNYFTYTLRKGTTAMATAVTTSATALTAGTPVTLTLTAPSVETTSVVNLLATEAATVTKVVHFQVQLDIEEAK